MIEIRGDETGVARLLAQPGCGGVAERMAVTRSSVAAWSARTAGGRVPCRAEERELVGKRRCERLPARLAALAGADEQ